jgi:hypothetical protein
VKHRDATAPPDWNAIYSTALAQLGGPVSVETPQLGRVEFPRPSELYAALNFLKLAQAEASGVATAGVFVVGHRRGLEPKEEI